MLLFTVPIYRMSPRKWDEEFVNEYSQIITEEENYQLNRHYVHYKYNDIIAWIEITYSTFKIKGRLFTTDKKRYTRNFTGQFVRNFNIGDIDIHTLNRSNEDIISEIVDRVERYRKRSFNNRFIDTRVITEGGRYLDFKKIYEDHRASR